jgi:sugar lactone lactonase YvrE
MNPDLSPLFESTEPAVLATGFTFAEGPVWHPDDVLYFSDIRESKRYKLDTATQNVTLIAENTHGGNGMTFDHNGRLIVCQPGRRRVIATQISADSDAIVISDNFKGKKLNAPNDVVTHSNGDIYFTNPEGRISGDEAEIGYSGVYRASTNGETSEVCAGMNLPNGLAFSPDESLLYVSNTRPDPKLYVYEMQPDGAAVNGRTFAEMPLINGDEKNGVPDGLKVDSQGKIFCTGPGGIWVWEQSGGLLGVMKFPEVTTNLAWGDSDLRTMYVTGHSSIYSLRIRQPGVGSPVFS